MTASKRRKCRRLLDTPLKSPRKGGVVGGRLRRFAAVLALIAFGMATGAGAAQATSSHATTSTIHTADFWW
jgi:hypothetical protein